MSKVLTFIGCRTHADCTVLCGGDGDYLVPLGHPDYSQEDAQDQFEWGYGGAGPRHLAFALLYRVCGDRRVAELLEQHYKWDVVSRLPRAFWQLSSLSIEAWLVEQIAKLPAPPTDDSAPLDLGVN